jgi:uncharacterized membrane protein
VSPGTRRGDNGGSGNGNGAGGFDDFIRDREDPWENPRADYDPYEDFAASGSSRQSGFGSAGLGDRGLVDSITRIIETLASTAGDALSPDTRRQLEKALRDLLVVLRDVIDAMIERIDRRRENDIEIEEIPID